MSNGAGKSSLRRTLGATRGRVAAADGATRAAGLCQQLMLLLGRYRPTKLVAYRPLGGEIDPSGAIALHARSGVPVYLPRWEGGAGEFVRIGTGERLVDDDPSVVILVPGIAFDWNGNRLGRGGGWYDRMLVRHSRARRVGCAYDEQLIDHVPREPWDVAMHHVVTDARSISVDGHARPAGECAHDWA